MTSDKRQTAQPRSLTIPKLRCDLWALRVTGTRIAFAADPTSTGFWEGFCYAEHLQQTCYEAEAADVDIAEEVRARP